MNLKKFVNVAAVVSLATLGSVVVSTGAYAYAAPRNGGGHFDVSDGSAEVSGTLNFTGARTFTLSNVDLTDRACDARYAFFYAVDNVGHFAEHRNGNGCHTTIHWDSLSGGSSAGDPDVEYLYIHVQACSLTSGCSGGADSPAFDNPNT